MKKKEILRVCKRQGCNNELPFRYKGVPKQYCSPECRKLHHGGKLTAKDIERIEKRSYDSGFLS